MTKRIHKVWIIFVVFLCLCWFGSLQTFASYIYGKCGDNAEFRQYDNGELVISGDGFINENFFSGVDSIKSVRIEVSTIKSGAFSYCFNLESIAFGSSLERIEHYAFCACTKLSKVIIGKRVTFIGDSAFYSCINLKDIYYTGSESQWKSIEGIDTAGFPKDARIHFETNISQILSLKIIRSPGISHKIAAGKKITLKAEVFPATAVNKKLKWSSSNTKIATVNQKGKVTIKKKTGGKTVTITAMATDGSKMKASFKIKVMKGAVKKITIKGARKKLKAGRTMKLKARVKASNGANKKIRWISSNMDWATVSSTGKVKALKAGKGKKVKITAMATDGSGKKKTVTIKIK